MVDVNTAQNGHDQFVRLNVRIQRHGDYDGYHIYLFGSAVVWVSTERCCEKESKRNMPGAQQPAASQGASAGSGPPVQVPAGTAPQVFTDSQGGKVLAGIWIEKAAAQWQTVLPKNARTTMEKMRNHVSALPLDNWIFFRSIMIIPQGSILALNSLTGNIIHASWDVKPPEEYSSVRAKGRVIKKDLMWRFAGIEACPTYDWLAFGMTYYLATVAEWFNAKTSWSTWEQVEQSGGGLSVIALAGFATLRQLRDGAGYPAAWTPYIVICAWIEEKRYIRSVNTRMAFTRLGLEWDQGRAGVLARDLADDLGLEERKPEDTKHLVVYAAMVVAQTQHGMQTPHLKSAHFCFYPGSNSPPEIGADAEEMDINALKDSVKRLKTAQFVPPDLFWSVGTDLKLIERDCGIPVVMPTTAEGISEAYDRICEKAKRSVVCTMNSPPILPDPQLEEVHGAENVLNPIERTRRRDRIMHALGKLVGKLPIKPEDLGSRGPDSSSAAAPTKASQSAPTVSKASPKAPPTASASAHTRDASASLLQAGPADSSTGRQAESTSFQPSARSREPSKNVSVENPRRGRNMGESQKTARTESSVRRAQSVERRSEVTGGSRSFSATPSGRVVANQPSNIVGAKMKYSDYNCFRRVRPVGGQDHVVRKLSMLMTEERANELDFHTMPDHDGDKYGKIGAVNGVPAVNPALTPLICHYLGGIDNDDDEEVSLQPNEFSHLRPHLAPTHEQARAIAAECQRLDGVFWHSHAEQRPSTWVQNSPEHKNYRADLAVKSLKYVQALKSARQMRLDYRQMCPEHDYRPDSDRGELTDLIRQRADNTCLKPYQIGKRVAKGNLGGAGTTSVSGAYERVDINAPAGWHMAQIAYHYLRCSGIASRPVLVALHETLPMGPKPGIMEYFAGCEIRVAPFAGAPHESLQFDPNTGSTLCVIFVGWIYDKWAQLPRFDTWCAAPDSPKETVIRAGWEVKSLKSILLPAAYQTILRYAVGPLSSQDDHGVQEGADLSNFMGTTEGCFLSQGIYDKAFCRFGAPGFPMTPGWYAWACRSDCTPGVQPIEYPAYIFSSRSFLTQVQDGDWGKKAPWEVPPDETLLEEAIQILNRAHKGGKIDLGPVRHRQNAANCCLAIPVCWLAQHAKGPEYLRNFRRMYTVNLPAGSDKLVITPDSQLRINPATAELYEELAMSLTFPQPWCPNAEATQGGGFALPPDPNDGVSHEDPSEHDHDGGSTITGITSLVMLEVGEVEGATDAEALARWTFMGGCLPPGKEFNIRDIVEQYETKNYLELAAEDAWDKIEHNTSCFPAPAHFDVIGGPGWGILRPTALWERTMLAKVELVPSPPLKRLFPTEYAVEQIGRMGFDFNIFEGARISIDPGIDTKRLSYSNVLNPLVDVCSLSHTVLEFIGSIKWIQFDDMGPNYDSFEEDRREFVDRVYRAFSDPARINGLRVIQFPDKHPYIEKYRKHRLYQDGEITKGDYRSNPTGSVFPSMTVAEILGPQESSGAKLNYKHLECTDVAKKYMAPGGWVWGDNDKKSSTILQHTYGYGIIAMASHLAGDMPNMGTKRKSGPNGENDPEPVFIGIRALDMALKIRVNPASGETRPAETVYQMMKDAFMPLLRYMESQEHMFSVVSRTHMPGDAPRSQVEGNAFLARVAEVTCILVSGQDKLGSKSIPDIVAKLGETWDNYVFTGKQPGEVRGKCLTDDLIDTYSQDMENTYGIKFVSPIKRVRDNKPKTKPQEDHAL